MSAHAGVQQVQFLFMENQEQSGVQISTFQTLQGDVQWRPLQGHMLVSPVCLLISQIQNLFLYIRNGINAK